MAFKAGMPIAVCSMGYLAKLSAAADSVKACFKSYFKWLNYRFALVVPLVHENCFLNFSIS